MSNFHHITNAATKEVTIIPFTQEEEVANDALLAATNAALGKQVAAKRIAEIRLELADHLATVTVGTPAEQGQAKAAIGLLRAELALNKAKL